MDKQRWQDWLIVLVGAWLVLSNWLMPFPIPQSAPAFIGSAIFWNAILTGAIAMILGIAALASQTIWEEWVDIVLGIWLVSSPWALGFASLRGPFWNTVLSGAALLLISAWTLYSSSRSGRAA